jgi:hypothetical protein
VAASRADDPDRGVRAGRHASGGRGVLPRAGSALRRLARAEWGTVFPDVWRRLRARRLRALPLTAASCAGILLLQLAQHVDALGDWVERLGGVYATLPWWTALLRTPLSLFVPDPSLPVWGLVLQVVVVFGIAEATLGAPRTLTVALLATVAGTCLARWSLWAGPGPYLGLAAQAVRVRDTGPSAAVVALGVYTAVRYRAWYTATAILLAMVLEVIWVTNLAGYEHLAGVAAVLALTAAEPVVRGRPRSRARSRGCGPARG